MSSSSPLPHALQVKLLRIREQIQNEHRQTDKDNLFNPLVSPGPASIALLDNKITGNVGVSNTSNTSDSSKKGMFAAAALSAAVTRPLPLKKKKTISNLEFNDSHKEKWNVNESFIAPKNNNIITCLCGIDGKIDSLKLSRSLLIQCNHCNRWQHLKCYGLKNKLDILPIKFYCHFCKPGLSTDSYKINKKIKLLQRQKEKMKLLKLEIKNQNQNQNLNILKQNDTRLQQNLTLNDITSTGSESSSPANSETNSRKNSTGKPLETLGSYQYSDKYIKSFIDDHSNDDWVVQINKVLEISPEFIETKKIDNNTTGVFAKIAFKEKHYIYEYPGMIDFQKNYISDPSNQYRICATTLPQVLFHPHWPILIDARSFDGNDSDNKIKFIRRSCDPNVEISTIKINSQKTNQTEIHFMINAIKDIKPGDELLVGWQWDLRHPISRMINNKYATESMDDMDKLWLVHAIDMIWNTSRCGCSDEKECKLLEIKKYADAFLNTLVKKKKHFN